MTIVEFLLARIAEDEAIARAASPGRWQYGGVASVGGGTLYDETRRIADIAYEQPEDHDGSIVRHLLTSEADANGAHITRHDPARVLAECEAKRRIVEDLAKPYIVERRRLMGGWPSWGDENPDLLRLLTLPYAGHADFREEWRL